jgi:hypothetical protein
VFYADIFKVHPGGTNIGKEPTQFPWLIGYHDEHYGVTSGSRAMFTGHPGISIGSGLKALGK